jgi:hypothetical protein
MKHAQHRENQFTGAEGATASETLRPTDRCCYEDSGEWHISVPAEGIAISGTRTEGASRAGLRPLRQSGAVGYLPIRPAKLKEVADVRTAAHRTI